MTSRLLVSYTRIQNQYELQRQKKAIAQWVKRHEDKLVAEFSETGDPGDELEKAMRRVLGDPLVDGLIVERLSIPFTSQAEAAMAIEELEAKGKVLVVTGIDLVVYQTPKKTMGKLATAMADLQEDILSGRLAVGRSRRKVRIGGRPEVPIDIDELKKLLAKREAGVRLGMNTIAGELGVSVRTLERRINKWKEEGLLE